MSNKIIKNVNIITMNKDKDIIENGCVVIQGDSILDLGNEDIIKKYNIDDFEVIDGEQGILMPGMINAHTHTPMVVFRSLGDDVADRLKRYIFPLEKLLVDEELVYKGTKYSIAEMILGGVTTYCNSYYYQDEVAKATKDMKMRAVLGETVINFVAPDAKEPYEGLKYAEWFIPKWLGDELITPAIAPHAPYSNDTEHLKMAQKLAEKFNIPITMHVAEMDYEQKQYYEQFGMTPVEYLDSIGMLNENFIAAHLVNVNDNDLDILEKRNVGISHNIGANSKGAKGVAPVVKMYKRGLKLGLGTDGAMSGNTLDILTQMPLVGKIHKLHNMDRTLFPASEIVEMATIGGARALNLDHKIGSVERGKKADLVILETKSVNMFPIYDYYSVIVYSANPSNVNTVMVNGEILVRDKKLIKSDLNEIRAEVSALREKISHIANNELSQ